MSLPPVRKRKDYSDIDKNDLVFALFYDRIAPTDAMSEQGEERKSIEALEVLIPDPEVRETIGAISSEVDRAAWRRKAIRAVKDGKSAAVKFVSAAIAESEQTRIRAALGAAKTVGDVVQVFDDPGEAPPELKAADDPIDALIDEELDAALAWAQKASEG